MRLARLACLALAAAGAWAALPPAAHAAPGPPSPSCNGGGCGGWFKSNVTVSWSYDQSGVTSATGCGASSVTNDTSGATFTCTVNYGGPFYGNSVTVRKDSTPPSVTGKLARGPDANGWYTSPVAATFEGDGGASGISSCTSGTYGGPDGAAVGVTGSCTDGAGNTASTSLTIKYDAAPPTVTPAADRPPDVDGWYNHPVTVAFTGQDGGSGVAECTAPVGYTGPDANPAKLVGQCRDAAGHLSAPVTLELRYDATKPARPTVKASRAGASVALSWTAAADAVRSEVVRAPGRSGKKPTVLLSGKARRLVDRKTRPDARYWYEVRVYDQAGNVSSKTLALRPSEGILAPAAGAVVRKPPVVSWSAVKKARFYNVQLWRKGAKLLTTWPRSTRLRLKDSWSFEGKHLTLANGRYRLLVWPALGTVADPRYGKLVGRVDFVFKRR